jgi:2-amino-4-hydroxy-6-hydroxymethyldihydropteridine diphosphokinase
MIGAANVVLGLGSNLGDRAATLQGAVDRLADYLAVVAVSPIVETDPVGGPDQGRFLNAIVMCRSHRDPLDVLAVAQEVEQFFHRTREVRWGPRTLDVDVIAIDGVTSDDHVLTLPHPRAHERGFVLIPWSLVDPDAVLAGHGRIADLAERVGHSGVALYPEAVLRVPTVGHS